MTDEELFEGELLAIERDAYVQFGIPDVPFSAVRVPVHNDTDEEVISKAMQFAAMVRNAFLDTFGVADVQPRHQEGSRARNERHEQAEQRKSAQVNTAVAFCPEHDAAPCRFSAPKYNKYGDRLYHPLDVDDYYRNDRGETVKNHSLYWRQTVDADGESNQGKPLPGQQREPVAEGRKRTMSGGEYEPQDAPPPDDSDLPW